MVDEVDDGDIDDDGGGNGDDDHDDDNDAAIGDAHDDDNNANDDDDAKKTIALYQSLARQGLNENRHACLGDGHRNMTDNVKFSRRDAS